MLIHTTEEQISQLRDSLKYVIQLSSLCDLQLTGDRLIIHVGGLASLVELGQKITEWALAHWHPADLAANASVRESFHTDIYIVRFPGVSFRVADQTPVNHSR